MAVWSSFAFKNTGKLGIAKTIIASLKNASKGKGANYVPVRNSHDRTLDIRNSTFINYKLKDMIYLYIALGGLPFIAIITYANIFIGPAKLALIPEGYVPQEWEYHRHPITRFFAKHVTITKQEIYERTLHNIHVKNEVRMLKKLEARVKDMIAQKGDYQSWYFEKAPTKYIRKAKEDAVATEKRAGYAGGWIV